MPLGAMSELWPKLASFVPNRRIQRISAGASARDSLHVVQYMTEYLFGACFRQILSAHQCGDHSCPEIVFVAAAYCLVLFEYGRGPLDVT